MSGGRRDVESDLGHLIARDAQIAVRTLRRGAYTNVDASLGYLIDRAYKSPGQVARRAGPPCSTSTDAEARALLYRAARLARYPVEPEPLRP